MIIQKLQRLQAKWAKQIQIPKESQLTYFLENPILALDIQYEDEKAYLGGSLALPNGTQIDFTAESQTGISYIPGLFCFREGPPLQAFIKKTQDSTTCSKPKLLIIDGHGQAHPEKLGVATWLGIRLNTPTIGCAKKSLLWYKGDLGEERGSTLPVFNQDEKVGEVLRTQDGINPLFVSIGNLISLEDARKVILNLSGNYRLPDLLRRADQLARAAARQDLPPNVINLEVCESIL
jgi:deoxyribonuclease V